MIALFKRVYRKLLYLVLAPLFTEIKRTSSEKSEPEYIKLIQRSDKAGFDYHQKMVNRNPDLMQWVLKDNYIDKE